MIKELQIMLDTGAFAPERAHATDAGLDLKSPVDVKVRARSYETIDTGVHVVLPPGTVGFIKAKSGLNVRRNITTTGVIDEGYTGSIAVKLYNNGYFDVDIRKGDKIAQLVVLPCLYVEPVLTDKLPDTDRGSNGFGSTGR